VRFLAGDAPQVGCAPDEQGVAGIIEAVGDLPLLAPLHAELEGITLQSEELDARHEALKAETREV
jgi:hypothetical protein